MAPNGCEAPNERRELDTTVVGRAEFANGWHDLRAAFLRVASGWTPKLSSPGEKFCIVRQSPRLLRWHAQVGSFPLDSHQQQQYQAHDAKAAVPSLAEALDGVVRDVAPELFSNRKLRYEIGNVICRDFSDPKAQGYTSTVHRDLDETAVGNLRRRGAALFLNFWVPFTPVTSNHLAICIPSSVDMSTQAAPFKGLPGDRTGLQWDGRQQWVVAGDLQPGDVLIWQSDAVYHANLTGPIDAGGQQSLTVSANPRKSADLRLWYFGTCAAVGAA